MLEISILGSGSSGNSALVVSRGGTRFLIDAGLSCKQLRERMKLRGVEADELDGILLTHEHGDHTSGLRVLCRKASVPLYCNPLTREILENQVEGGAWRSFASGGTFSIGDVEVEAFSIPHDAVDPMGFMLRSGSASFGYLSDLGFVTSLVRTKLKGVQTLYVESNYDEGMLVNDSKRPWSLKQRIMSRHGHLSNEQTAELIRDIHHDGLERVILGHLSRDCNTPEVAERSMRSTLDALGAGSVPVHCATQESSTPWYKVGEDAPTQIPVAEPVAAANSPTTHDEEMLFASKWAQMDLF